MKSLAVLRRATDSVMLTPGMTAERLRRGHRARFAAYWDEVLAVTSLQSTASWKIKLTPRVIGGNLQGSHLHAVKLTNYVAKAGD